VCSLLATAVPGLRVRERPGARPSLTDCFGVEPPPDSNRRPHPYHESRTHRCAELHSRSSPATVEGQVMCSRWAGGFVRLSASSATVIPATTTLKLRRLVAGRLRVGLRPGWRRHGPELLPGATRSGIALGPVPSRPVHPRPLPPGRAGPRIVPWTWTGQTPRRAATYKYSPSNPERARRSSSGADHARHAAACRAAARPAIPLGVSG
jgi:hypothetical protein